MKKPLVILAILFLTCICVYAAPKTLNFEWQQDEMVTGDYWEMHYGPTAGGPYSLLTSIAYTSGQSSYQQEVPDIEIPTGGAYFVLKKVRASDGVSSDWSNEVFYKGVSAPFQLRIILI